MNNQIEIYKSADNRIELQVNFEKETVWLNRNQLSVLFDRDIKTIGKHVNNIFNEGELIENSVVANFATTAADGKTYQVAHYNLDVIISVGYRVKSQRGTQFRQWATQRLKDYLVQGYAINEKRLAQKELEVQYIKSGIRILNRMIEDKSRDLEANAAMQHLLVLFTQGLELLDDYDHEQLDQKSISLQPVVVPAYSEYLQLIEKMRTEFDSDIFGRPKDKSFSSSIHQILQTFDGKDLYPGTEEKAAMLLYLIVKNHSFIDGNKRIAAGCFLLFLQRNNLLFKTDGHPIISNEALATLTLFVASSKPEEMETVKRLIISILNRNRG